MSPNRSAGAIALAVGMLAFANTVLADEALAKKHNCTACHQVDAKTVGPAYREVAKKYKGQPAVAAKLADKVRKGGAGTWGQVPMPPNPTVPDGDVKKLVDWILKLA